MLINSGSSEGGREGTNGDDELVVCHSEGLIGLLIGLLLSSSLGLGKVGGRSTDGSGRWRSGELGGRVGDGRGDSDGLSTEVWWREIEVGSEWAEICEIRQGRDQHQVVAHEQSDGRFTHRWQKP